MFCGVDYRENTLNISIDLLSECNLNCSYCYNKFEKTYPRFACLNRKDLIDILETFKKIKYNIVVKILGGEPTLSPFLNFFCTELYKLKNVSKVLLVTNGTRIDKILSLESNEKLEINFSVHPYSTNYLSIKKCIDCLVQKNQKIVVQLLMDNRFRDVLSSFYKSIKKYEDLGKITVFNEYIFNKNDKLDFVEPIASEKKRFTDNNIKYTLEEAIDLKFKKCYLTNYRIFADGAIILECKGTYIGNIKDRNFSVFKIRLVNCKSKCNDDCFLSMKKV